MKITFLGTGTSIGVPEIGCKCEVCTSADPRDKRLRTSVLVESEKTRILLDCGPDFRQQMLPLEFRKIDALFLSHIHYDHVGGIDDLRPFCQMGDIEIFAEGNVCNSLRRTMPYCFGENLYPGVPKINLNEIGIDDVLTINEMRVQPIRVMHGELPIMGYRINDMAYLTDLKRLPEEELPKLRGLKVLIMGALRHEEHNTHQTIEEAIQLANIIGAERTYFIHFAHQLGLHAEESQKLPEDVYLSYDGLQVMV